MQLLVQPCRNRPAKFARCTRCPPGACQRRLLPLPVFCSVGSLMCYSCRRCNIASPERGGGPAKAGGGVLLKSFTPVSDFTEETPQSAYGSHLPFQGRLLQKKHFCATSSAAMSKPSGGIRSFLAVRLGLANADCCPCLYR